MEADLSYCVLTHAIFRNANLSGANLTGADLQHADLTGANLTRATLIGAKLQGAVLTDSQWDLARLAGATLDDLQLGELAAFGAGLPVMIPSPEIQSAGSEVYSIAWAPCHDLIATGHDNGTLVLWDASSGKELRAFNGHEKYVMSVAFSPDGSRLASGSSD